MPKHTIVFNLPEEKEELKCAMLGIQYSIALDNIDNYLRNKLKYHELTDEQDKIYTEIRNLVIEEMNAIIED